jgi:hypothetical protein
MPDITVSDATVAAINKARDDQNAAGMADQDVTNSQSALQSAQTAYQSAQDKSVAAHKQALASAHAAVNALAGELGLTSSPAAQRP